MKISISTETCIKCGKCVKVCPINVFTQEPKSVPVVANPGMCIKCGQCVSVCPTSSVSHELFPSEKVHSIDYSMLPTADSMMLLLKSRRSNRALKKTPVPDELLDKIIEAANVAPTASNSQQVNYTLITDKEKLKEITEFTLSSFESKLKFLDNKIAKYLLGKTSPKLLRYIPLVKEMRRQFSEGNDLILRNAPVLLLIHSPKSNQYKEVDCNLAYQNGSLMAQALGVSQIYGGFVLNAVRSNPKGFAKIIKTEEVVCAVMALGMPQFSYPNYVDRKDANVERL